MASSANGVRLALASMPRLTVPNSCVAGMISSEYIDIPNGVVRDSHMYHIHFLATTYSLPQNAASTTESAPRACSAAGTAGIGPPKPCQAILIATTAAADAPASARLRRLKVEAPRRARSLASCRHRFFLQTQNRYIPANEYERSGHQGCEKRASYQRLALR